MRLENSTDATRGQALGERVLMRMAELEAALAATGEHDSLMRETLTLALASAEELITGDLAHPSSVVASEINTWLERHKHLAEDAITGPDWVGQAHTTSPEPMDDTLDTPQHTTFSTSG